MKVEIELNFFEKFLNFFRADSGEIVGIYHDGEKIFLAHLTDGVEVIESSFEIDENENISPAEQLAEKVAFLCAKNGWKTSKTALCLREGETVTFQPDFTNIPQEKIESAVKIWATAQVGENVFYTSAKICGEFWSEAISKVEAEKYISAWKKNSMTLCALTSLTGIFSDKAVFVARLIAEKKSPNLLPNQIENWNFKKIFATAAGIFFIVSTSIFGKIYYDFYTATKNFEMVQENLSAKNEISDAQKTFEENISELQNLNELLAGQKQDQKLNMLIALGKISDDKIKLTKINLSESSTEIEGAAKKSAEIRNYLSRLKNIFQQTANIENIEAGNGKIIFKIRLTFQ